MVSREREHRGMSFDSQNEADPDYPEITAKQQFIVSQLNLLNDKYPVSVSNRSNGQIYTVRNVSRDKVLDKCRQLFLDQDIIIEDDIRSDCVSIKATFKSIANVSSPLLQCLLDPAINVLGLFVFLQSILVVSLLF
jgi:hypothetical protein